MASTIAGELIWNLDVDSSKFDSSLNKASSSIKGFGSSMDSLAKNLDATGNKLTAFGAAPAAALGLSVKAAIDFESAFAGVRKTVDASEEEFAQLSSNIRNMAKEIPTSANELARIGEIAGQLGIRGVDNLTKFIKTVADISVSTDLTSEAAAISFARISNIMQEPIENVDRLGASIVDLGNNFAATEPEIAEFANRIAGAGKIAGLSTADILGIGTAMSSVGIQAEAGGTAVQKVLIKMTQAASGSTSSIIDNSKAIGKNSQKLQDLQSKLNIATKQQSEFGDKVKESTRLTKQAQIDKYRSQISGLEGTLGTLKDTHGQAAVSAESFAKVLGVTNAEFSKMFKDNPAQVFEDFVTKLGKSGDKAFDILEELELKDVRLNRAFLSLGNAGDLLSRSIDTSNEAWKENTALIEEAEKRYATTESQIQIFRNRLNDIGITIGDAVLPKINELLDRLTPLIEKFTEFAENNPELIAGILILGSAIGALGIGMKIAAVIIGGISALLSPITLVVLAIAAVAFILYKAWTENWGGIQEKTKAVAEFLGDVFNRLREFWEEWGPYVTDFFSAVFGAIWDSISTTVNDISLLVQFVFGEIEKFWEEHGETITELVQNMWTIIKGIWDLYLGLMSASLTIFTALITGNWEEAGDKLEKSTDKAWEGIKKIITGVLDSLKIAFGDFVEDVKSKLESLWNKATEYAGKIKDALNQISPFHKESPSLVEYVAMGTTQIEALYSNLADSIADMPFRDGLMGFSPGVSPAVVGGGYSGTVNVNATINNDLDAYGLAKIIGFELEARSR